MITPKTKNYVTVGKVNLPGRTEIQIREAIKNIYERYSEQFALNEDLNAIFDAFIEEMGLNIELAILPGE